MGGGHTVVIRYCVEASVHHVFIFLHLEFSFDLHSEFEIEERDQFALWISFAEIYNEQIYDLLEPVNMKEKKRTVLKLGEDKNGQPYIKGSYVLRKVYAQVN